MAKAHNPIDDNDKKTETFAETAPKNIPRVEEEIKPGGQPGPKIEEYKGKFTRKSDQEEYAVAYKPDNMFGRTHHAQNTLHYWEGTQEQFRKNFTTDDGEEITDKNDPGTDSKGQPKTEKDEK